MTVGGRAFGVRRTSFQKRRWGDEGLGIGRFRYAGRPRCAEGGSSGVSRTSKIYNNKPWALDWVGGLHKPGCGAVVFLSDDNGATWYCCLGVEKSESARNTYDGRSSRTFFLTSVFDKDGKNWVKEDKKVGLDLRLFQRYGVKAFSMKVFDASGDGAELRMLTAEQFLSRTNGYRVTGCLPVVDSSLELTKPLEGATALIEQNEDKEDGGSCGPREDGGDYEYMDVGDENMQDQNMLGDDDVGITSEHGLGDIPAGSVGPTVGQQLSSPAICHSQGGSQGGHDSQEHGGSKSRKKTRKTSPSASAHKRQSRTGAVNEACGALIASQEARPPRKSSQGGRSGGRGRGHGGARKGKQIVRAEELRDAGDEGEGVGPRMLDDGDEPLQQAAPIDTTRNAIESSITTEPGAWDRPELVLAPVDRNEIVGGQGRRITPTKFFERDSSEFDWYAVCGQHTIEVMKILVKKGSPAVDVYGLRAYSKVRVVYFGDDQTRGYFIVSAFDNTRENRAMMLSFKDAVRDMRQWWIDNHRIEASKDKVSDKDAVVVAHQKKWQNFLRASMGKACDKAFVKQALENEYSKDWSNKLRGYMNLATSTEVVAVILDISPANFCVTWTSQEFDALHSMMTKCCGVNWVLFVFAPQKVQSDVLRCLFRWEDIELILGTWKRVDRPSNDITRYGNIATASRDMMVIVLHAEGGDLRKVTVAPHLVNDLTNVHVVEEKFGKCLGKHGGIEGDKSVVYSIWEREPGKLRSLCGSFVEEAEGVLLLGRAHAGLVWEFLLAGNNVIVCDESAKDIAYFTKFIDILVKDDRFNCHVEKPRCKHRPNRDMLHKLGPKRLKVWEYLFRDMPQGRLDGKYIYRKAKATETLKHYHGALTGAFETFVARCEILKFDLRKDKLTSKDYAELAKSGDGFNSVDSEEDSSDSDLELGEDTCAEVPRGGMVQAHDDGTVHSHGGSIPVAAPSVASMVAPSETTALQDVGRCGGNEEDDIEIPGEASMLALGDAIPPGYWQSEAAIKAKAEELFHVLRDNRQLEYNNKFYALRSSPSRGSINWKVDQTARTLEGSCSHDFMPSAEPASVAAQAGHMEDDGTTVVGPQEVDITSKPQILEKSISVAAAQSSPPIDVSTTLPPDASATYGSLLITNAAMQGRSEIESESDVGPSVAESQLQPSLCTGKGDAQSPLTPQGGAGADGGKGGDVEGMHRSRNLDTLTADID
ncbi:hypothetical protein CBR_g4106 [Chara braunii]|uniref:Uncharacterized protein n=1 Tax=Chara braunii TaxID=69332 RepID=A0A388KH95_CHABU|nr:hypothetical protein CBR_g4106 [Chara braunii]|eukprot:GBG69411.1 hypothetical protein CBR_g4106 [Chara braunii]